MKCPVREDGYCLRHKENHAGRLLELSQEDSAQGEAYRRLWDRLAIERARREQGFGPLDSDLRDRVPCRYLGEPTGATIGCQLTGQVEAAYQCERYEFCTVKGPKIREVPCCDVCAKYQARGEDLIYPSGSAPHHGGYLNHVGLVTVAIPVLNCPDHLGVALELWRAQTERPRILLIDTGSKKVQRDKLEAYRALDVEVHLLAGHDYMHPHANIGLALDFAQVRCRTPILVHTHSDVFLASRDTLRKLLRSGDRGNSRRRLADVASTKDRRAVEGTGVAHAYGPARETNSSGRGNA